MPGQNYYLITALPDLGHLGSDPAMTPAELLDHIEPSPDATEIVKAIFLADDLLQRDALVSGEISEVTPAVLTADQITGEEPLPDYLTVTEAAAFRIAGDALWAAYYRYSASQASDLGCEFLREWVAYQVGLRNALATARAKNLRLDPTEYLVATELAGNEDFSAVVSEWSAAATPLMGLQVVDRAQWNWITSHGAWFSFKDDELAAYAAKLMLLNRWYRLAEAQKTPESSESDSSASS